MPPKGKVGKGSDSITDSTKTHDSNLRSLSHQLELQGLKFGDRETRKAAIVQKVRQLIVGERLSKMGDEEAEQFEAARYEYRDRSEADFIHHVWCLLLLPTRTVKKAEEEGLSNDERVLRAFKDDHLDMTISSDFFKESIPALDTSQDPVLEVLLACLPRIKTPRPDRAYGLRNDAFTEEQINLNEIVKKISRVARSIYYTFFIIEFKSSNAPILEAQLQARRSGACLVHSMREFKRKAGILNDTTVEDNGSFVFSIAMVPDQAQLFVHWAVEGSNRRVTYHMHELNSYSITQAGAVKDLRRDVDNVMEWGLTIRKEYIKQGLAMIRARDPAIKKAVSNMVASSKAAELVHEDSEEDGEEVAEDDEEDELSR